MPLFMRIVLDVLKPHQPNALDFVKRIQELEGITRVKLTLAEMDEKTETVVVLIEGTDLEYERIVERILEMGGSVHSIDEVEMASMPAEDDERQ